jgi:hypothetical protein
MFLALIAVVKLPESSSKTAEMSENQREKQRGSADQSFAPIAVSAKSTMAWYVWRWLPLLSLAAMKSNLSKNGAGTCHARFDQWTIGQK